jgi:hypothetical protein
MEIFRIVVSVVFALFVGYHLYRLMFEDSEEFWECVRFSMTPNIISMFRGEYLEDTLKSFKPHAFLLAVGVCGFFAHLGLTRLFGPD